MYLGNQPALSYTSFAKQDFTTSATTAYTLSQPVANENEIALFINFVRQEPTTAYTASGTSLTLTSATSASDDMYAIFLGKAVQTVNPPAGSVDSSKINYPLTTFSSTGIDDNATSTAITINSSQNVGIGTSNVFGKLCVSNGSDNNFEIFMTNTGGGSDTTLQAYNRSGSAYKNLLLSSLNQQFLTSGSERMRIDSNGKVQIGSADTTGRLNVNAVDMDGIFIRHGDTNSGIKISSQNNTMTAMTFTTNYGTVGTITSGASTAYNTSSDYRLKENVTYDFDATTRLKQLKPARFNFISDANSTVDGFLAHEVSSVVPEAITGEKDATETKEKVVVNANGNVIAENIEQADWEAGKIADEEGKSQYPTDSTWEATKVVPVYQGIDQSKLVPLLVKTIQELEARIIALENK